MRISMKKKSKMSTAQAMLENSKSIIVWDFRCLGANQMSDLRLKAATNNIGMKVLPASLLKTTISNQGVTIPRDTRISGQLLCAFGEDVHSIVSFLKVIGIGKLRFGIERPNNFISCTNLVAVSKVPTVNYLRCQLCWLVKLPLARIVNVLTLAAQSATNAPTNRGDIVMQTKEELIESIGAMTALDLCDLAELLKKRFGITADPSQSTDNLSVSSNQDVPQQTTFSIHLDKAGGNKLSVVKVAKEITELSLKETKTLVDRAPVVLKDNLSKSQAEEFQVKLKAVGAEVTVK